MFGAIDSRLHATSYVSFLFGSENLCALGSTVTVAPCAAFKGPERISILERSENQQVLKDFICYCLIRLLIL